MGIREDDFFDGTEEEEGSASFTGRVFLGTVSASFGEEVLEVLNNHRKIFKSQGSDGGLAETTGGALRTPLRRRSNSLRAEAQRFKCRATILRSRAERLSFK